MCLKDAVHQNGRVSMFLDLPRPLRHRIYENAGVLLDTSISLTPVGNPGNILPNPFRQLPQHNFTPTGEAGREACRLVRHLLLVCRVVHDEVLALVLSRNELIIGPNLEHITYGLRFLSNLSPYHCLCVSNVRVTLQQFPWNIWNIEMPSYPIKNQLERNMVAAWGQAACHLLAYTVPGKLKLRLICDQSVPPFVDEKDADDGSIIHAIVQPFMQHAGKLANLDIRLAARPNRSLSRLARETVCVATGRQYLAPRQGIFRFFDLPAELRRQILEYTDLVTPDRMVEWNSEKGYSQPWFLRWDKGHEDPPKPAWTGYGYHGRSSSLIRWHRGYCEPETANGRVEFNPPDCCRARRSAFRDGCQCWSTPGYMMLVSRAFYHDAQTVFFSSNRVTVRPLFRQLLIESIYPNAPPPRKTLRLDASRFLTMHTWPRTALKHLRHLELVLSPFKHYHYDILCEQTYLDWDFAMKHLADHANTHNLTLSIHFSRELPFAGNVYDTYKKCYNGIFPTEKYNIWLRAAYTRFLTPIKRLRYLDCLFIHLESRWKENVRPTHVSQRIHDLELELEQLVMGADYDSAAKGKLEVEISPWLEEVWSIEE